MIAIVAAVVAAAATVGIIVTSAAPYFLPDVHNIIGAPSSSSSSEVKQQELNTDKSTPMINNSSSNGYPQVNVTVNGVELVADVAETDGQRTKGLSVKDTLHENEAMLFVFNTEAEHPFWMKNMKFPIDMIWLNNYKTVVHIEHNVQPCTLELFCQVYKPNNNSLYVLETASGFAERHGIVEGTTLKFELSS